MDVNIILAMKGFLHDTEKTGDEKGFAGTRRY